MRFSNIDWTKLAISVFICQLAGIIGSVFTSSSLGSWYSFLVKPSFTPPGWFIGTVWLVLYTLMGVALYLIWTSKVSKAKSKERAFLSFEVQLFLNALWSIVFFGAQSLQGGFVVIILMIFAISWTVFEFSKFSKPATGLLIPYLAWVCFATYLNYSIMVLN